MNGRSIWLRTVVATSAVFCVVLLANTSSAQFEVALPGATGVFDSEVISGEVLLPNAQDATDSRLIVTGTLVPGEESTGCPPSGPYATGAEMHLYLSVGGVELLFKGDLKLAPAAGAFVAEMPLFHACAPYAPLDSVGGNLSFELYIGYDPETEPVCIVTHFLPVVTIESARIVSNLAVATERTTWGGVKGLYR